MATLKLILPWKQNNSLAKERRAIYAFNSTFSYITYHTTFIFLHFLETIHTIIYFVFFYMYLTAYVFKNGFLEWHVHSPPPEAPLLQQFRSVCTLDTYNMVYTTMGDWRCVPWGHAMWGLAQVEIWRSWHWGEATERSSPIPCFLPTPCFPKQ